MASTVQAAQKMSSPAVLTPKAAQFVPVKPEFKNLTLEPMTVDSVVDELAGIVVLCAVPNSEAVKLSNTDLYNLVDDTETVSR